MKALAQNANSRDRQACANFKMRYDMISIVHGAISFCIAIEVSVKDDNKQSY